MLTNDCQSNLLYYPDRQQIKRVWHSKPWRIITWIWNHLLNLIKILSGKCAACKIKSFRWCMTSTDRLRRWTWFRLVVTMGTLLFPGHQVMLCYCSSGGRLHIITPQHNDSVNEKENHFVSVLTPSERWWGTLERSHSPVCLKRRPNSIMEEQRRTVCFSM